MRRVEVSPAALGSLALHAAVAAALMISWNTRDLQVGGVVPVNIVASGPAEPRPAEQAQETQAAMTEAPVAEAPPEVAPPPPTPAPPVPTPKAAKPPEKAAPTPAPKAARPAEKSLDLDALAQSLTTPARNAAQRPSSAQKGPTRAETAPTARQTAGDGLLASRAAVTGLTEELQRRWNPNCDVVGGREVLVRVVFRLGVGGQVVGDVKSEIVSAQTGVAQAGAERAVRAVYAAAPFRGLPREFYGSSIAVNFNAREACSA